MVSLKIFSVSEYVEFLNETLHERDAVVEGEVSEYKVNQGKWVFFKIKDDDSTLECFSIVYRIKFPLEDGMRVRLYGRPRIYAKNGRLSINVEWVEPAGEGALKRAFELLKAELQKEGLFSQERKRPLPRFPKRIGLITSRDAAAYGDFLKVLKARWGGVEIYFRHVQVQGVDAVESIAESFSVFNSRQKELRLDLIVLVRGGGSLEDLAAFNSREVAYAVFGASVPVVAGVGHEQDVTIADFVADVRASTPSNAAELIAPHRDELQNYVEGMTGEMEAATESLAQAAAGRVNDMVGVLDAEVSRRSHAFSSLFSNFALHLNFFGERVIMHKSKVEGFVRLLSSLSPQAVLERGYAIVKKGERVVTSVRVVHPKDEISVRLKDGEVGAEII